jgi:carbon storage regulator
LAKVIVVEIRGDKARLGLEFDKDVPVHRTEVFEAIEREQARQLEGTEGKPS